MRKAITAVVLCFFFLLLSSCIGKEDVKQLSPEEMTQYVQEGIGEESNDNFDRRVNWGSAPSISRMVKINGPVDVNIYDSDDNLVASIVDDIPQYRDTSGRMAYAENDYGMDIAYSLNEHGEKFAWTPTDEAYTIDILATDTGTMAYSVTEFSITSGTVRLINYYDVPISVGERLFGVVPAVSGDERSAALPHGSTSEYKLLDNSSAAISASEEFRGEEIDKEYRVTVTAENDSGYALGSGYFLRGSYAKIEAIALSTGGFIGWYMDGQLVSTAAVYRFAVMGDTNITARFIPVERYALYLNASAGGRITSVEGRYPAGTVAAIVAEADSGYTFVNWTSSNGGSFEDANNASTRFTMPHSGTVLTANFAKAGGTNP